MNKDNSRNLGFSLSLGDLLHVLFQKKWIVILLIVVSLIAAFIYDTFLKQPKYVSNAKIIVINSSDTGTISSTDITTATYLVADYAELIVDRAVLEEVGKQLSPKLTFEQLRGAVSVSIPENSRIIAISVTTANPEYSKQIADKVCEVAKKKITEVIGVDKVNQFGPASLPKTSSTHSRSSVLLFGFLVGVALSLGFAILYIYISDRVTSEDDIENYLDVPALARIPYNPSRAAASSKSKRKAAKK